MKKNLILLLILIVSIPLVANSQANSSPNYYYAELLIDYRRGFEASIDFGQNYPITIEDKNEVTKKIVTFKNKVDILNYLSDFGWELIFFDAEIRVMSDGESQTSVTFYFYTFRKLKTSEIKN